MNAQPVFWKRLNEEIAAGRPLAASLEGIIKETDEQGLHEALTSLKNHIVSGYSLSDALAQCPEQFSMPVIVLVRGGEEAGVLDKACQRIVDGFEDGTLAVPGETVDGPPLLRSLQLLWHMMEIGVPIMSVLSTIAQEFESTDLGNAWARVRETVDCGDDLAAGMAKSPQAFPTPVVDMIRRGEVACDLPGALRTIIRAISEDNLDSLSRTDTGPDAVTADAAVPSIIRTVSTIILDAYRQRASDIHLDPSADGTLHVRFRIDGIMRTHAEHDAAVTPQIINRLKIMAGLDVGEKRLPQDGRIVVKIEGTTLDLRVGVIRTLHGEHITIRIMSDIAKDFTLDRLDMGEVELRGLRRILEHDRGIVISSGPVGSGKTTLLYCMLKAVNDGQRAIFSVENPIGYVLPGVSQVAVQPDIGLTSSAALRSVMRHTPDVIMISGIRDPETLQIVAQGGVNGHLMLTELNTNSAAMAIRRLIDIGMEPFLVADTVCVITNQRLVRKLCIKCRKPIPLPTARLPRTVAQYAESIENAQYYEAVGCDQCGLGYRGRIAICEVMFMTERLKDAICANADTTRLNQIAQEAGMKTILQDGIAKASAGLTSIQEVARVTTSWKC